MIPMLASQLKQESDWRVIHCEILMDQSHTDTDEAFGNILIVSKHGVSICFGFTSYTNKEIEMHEIRILNADNIEICAHKDDDGEVIPTAYDIADQTNWRKIAINTKYEKVKRKVKSISFNLDNEADILYFAQSQKDFSNWVKNKILEEIR
ncbi:hypothetical protein E0H86_15090 [Acinetobacter sp. ANC 4635]|uniref:hypothetical protein n=1 Tax=Acinetobacter sp. ANC 4635 TaxID=2529846 RepID=UPI00103CA315|nr:hypothetical protein [Acinetobacter sp. ANC 4635]TCB24465.1 hypothetical protein E0H86_15090 [Acinetobacter sp. ANC 4635]